MVEYIFALAVGTIFGGLSWWIAMKKNRRPFLWATIGFLFGPFGLLVLAGRSTVGKPSVDIEDLALEEGVGPGAAQRNPQEGR